jgi:hypothetical protein
MVFRVMPIEHRGDMGCGEVFQPITEKLHGNIPKKLSAGRKRR